MGIHLGCEQRNIRTHHKVAINKSRPRKILTWYISVLLLEKRSYKKEISMTSEEGVERADGMDDRNQSVGLPTKTYRGTSQSRQETNQANSP